LFQDVLGDFVLGGISLFGISRLCVHLCELTHGSPRQTYNRNSAGPRNDQETSNYTLKMEGWNTFSFPFGMAYFEGRLLLVSGRVNLEIFGG